MPNWGAVLDGGIAGLAGGIAVVAPLLLAGVIDSNAFGGQASLIFAVFGAQVVAGALAARVANQHSALHGALAGSALSGVLAALSDVTGREASLGSLAFGMTVGTILGMAGGVLVDAAHRVEPD